MAEISMEAHCSW